MTEKGSDELLAEIGSLARAALPVEADQAALDAEEERVQVVTPSRREAGDDHPDPDEAPPADEEHDEFDPLPPE